MYFDSEWPLRGTREFVRRIPFLTRCLFRPSSTACHKFETIALPLQFMIVD